MSSLPGEHAVVTGAGRGIGTAIARALAAQGAKVSLLGRSRDSLDKLAAELSGSTEACVAVADVTDGSPLHTADDSLWDEMLAVNLGGVYRSIRCALPDMLQAGRGRIINIASVAGLTGYPYVTAYCAAKHGVIGLTRSLAMELARKNITVNAVCPGYSDTDMVRDAVANIQAKTGRDEAAARAALTAHNPQGRLIAPEEVAQTVLWLCSSGAGSITGQSIAVAGGEVM